MVYGHFPLTKGSFEKKPLGTKGQSLPCTVAVDELFDDIFVGFCPSGT